MSGFVLSDLLEEFLLDLQVKNYSRETVKTTKTSINQLIKFGGDIEINKINRLHLKKFIIDQQTKVKANTINHRLKLIRSMFSYAIEQGLLKENPMEGITKLKTEKNVIRTYSADLIREVLESFKGRDYISVRNKTIFVLLVETGIRNSELCNIKLSDLSGNSIRIMGKGSKVRYVPITESLDLQIKRYMRVRERYLNGVESDNLFINRFKKPMTRHVLLDIVKNQIFKGMDINVNTSVHQFRRFYAQNMLENTDLYTVSKLLGHSDIKTTETYIRGIENSKLIEKGMNSPLSKIRK
ncbi:tyrosine-type recombinase/integrase [Neobacillus rhizophilus]|uniref:Tyrosine-type recombinase/integrase n=1 Tax=Neobacillus rhizophilus TaxID=2833579 RepID=A0A942U9A1_9BACI|nr:tyrosine-type recombinase/integrase [Neobacillus rhizophilus]MBS4214943.1 tyrosine-type recombinase/integrase [Neobacillus rhizophilus]